MGKSELSKVRADAEITTSEIDYSLSLFLNGTVEVNLR